MKTKSTIATLTLAVGLLTLPSTAATASTTGAIHSVAANSRATIQTKHLAFATLSQRNAKETAANYLRFQAFSRKGLIEQLEYEGYSHKDAVYGVDANQVNWKLQAAKSAKNYLRTMAFSKSGLVNQLVYEGYSRAQATYGVSKSKANWNAQAVKKAKSYLQSMAFSRSGLIEQLVYEGFTQAQASYAVSRVGL